MNFQPRASHLVSTPRKVTLESQLYDLIRLLQGYGTTGFGLYLYPKDENSGAPVRSGTRHLAYDMHPLFTRHYLY